MSDVPSHAQPPPVSPGGESLDSSILRVLMDTSADRIYFKDRQSRFVRNNAAHARSLGANSPEECVGKTDFDFFSREHAEHAYRDGDMKAHRQPTEGAALIECMQEASIAAGWPVAERFMKMSSKRREA